MKKFFLSAAEAARALACDPQTLRSQAKSDPAALGFPVTVVGHRVRIPRAPFLDYTGISDEELRTLLYDKSPAQEAANA